MWISLLGLAGGEAEAVDAESSATRGDALPLPVLGESWGEGAQARGEK